MSDAVAPDATTAFARALVDEWARAGVRHACLAPGSRSAPLALALAADGRIQVHVHLDERAAGFFALGIAKSSGLPAVVACTSGTATANLHPAVLEAHHARVPLIVCTADRPPELRDVGAGQAIDQHDLYGGAVRWSHDPGPPTSAPSAGPTWRATAARAVAAALGPPAGPVHLNLPFREPLRPTGAPLVDAPGRADGRPWTTVTVARPIPDVDTVERIARAVRAAPRGALVAGWGTVVTPETATRFARAARWPILADPLSGLRVDGDVISTYDALLRFEPFAAAHRPGLVVRVGAPLTSKVATQWLTADVTQLVVDPDRSWLDPQRAAGDLLAVDAEVLLSGVAAALEADRGSPTDAGSGDTVWLDDWVRAEQRARAALDDTLDASEDLSEPRIARDVVRALPEGATLLVASSMPVRDVESFAAERSGVRFLANRGVNGIDGFTSTVLGAAAVGTGPTVALTGDLCFLHDSNGLLGARDRGVDATFVVVDNDGGGIFHFLPYADGSEEFEALFGTPQGVDLAALAAVHGLAVVEVDKARDLGRHVDDAIAAGGVRIVLARTDRSENVLRHRDAWDAVAAALRD